MRANTPPEHLRELRKEYKILTRRKRRNYDDQKGHAFIAQVVQEPTRFWKRFQKSKCSNKIRSKDTWQQYYGVLLSAKEMPTPVEISPPQLGMCNSDFKLKATLRDILLGEAAKALNVDITGK